MCFICNLKERLFAGSWDPGSRNSSGKQTQLKTVSIKIDLRRLQSYDLIFLSQAQGQRDHLFLKDECGVF